MRTVTLGSLGSVMPVVQAGVSAGQFYGFGTTEPSTLQRNATLVSGGLGLTAGLIIGYLVWKQ